MRTLRMIVAAMAIAVLLPAAGRAQNITRGNKYVQVTVNDQNGRFTITELYPNISPLTYNFTSHVNFNMIVSGAQKIYTNEDQYNVDQAFYRAPSRVYAQGDTIFTEWTNLFGYKVQQVMWPWLTFSSGQVAIEFRTAKVDSFTDNRMMGILLELDVYSAADPAYKRDCGTGDDNSVVLDANGYEAKPTLATSNCWTGLNKAYTGASVPEWYHAAQAFPNYTCSVCGFGTGLLKGASRQTPAPGDNSPAPRLVPPDEWYVGDWGNTQGVPGMKNVGWNVGAPYWSASGTYADCAVIYKWLVSGNSYRACTSYGPNDNINANLVCPDRGVFVDLRFPKRLYHNPDGTYTPPADTIRIWSANVDHTGSIARKMVATIDTTGTCILLKGSQPLTKPMNQVGGPASNDIQAQHSGYAEFIFSVDTSKCCIPGQTTFHEDSIKVSVTNSNFSSFYYPCYPTAQVECYSAPPDTISPASATVSAPFAKYKWNVQDNRQWDTGIDSVNVVQTQNFTVTIPPFPHCSKDSIIISADVVDTTKSGCLTIRVVDCARNVRIITQCYSPSPDRFLPIITVTDASHRSVGASLCTDNFQCGRLHVTDSGGYNLGLKSVNILQSTNYNYTVQPFGVNAKSTDVDACVKDSMYNAVLQLEAEDVVGNKSPATTVNYCTVQDSKPPYATGGLNGGVYTYTITDNSAWDRGLMDVQVVSNNNFNVTGPTFTTDHRQATISFTIADTSKDGDFCFVARDSFFFYQTDSARFMMGDTNHTTRVCGSSTSGIDTLAPVVRIIPNPATNGYDATVIVTDRHYLGDGTLYKRDKHLNNIRLFGAINVDTSDRPAIQTCQDDTITFVIRCADSLSLTDTTACLSIQATDCQGLSSNIASWCYGIKPDHKAPMVTFVNGATRDIVTFHATDSTAYDRGLASLVIDSTINVAPVSDTTIGGARVHDITLRIQDTSKPAHARICVTDMFTKVHPELLGSQQTCFDFDAYVGSVWPQAMSVSPGGNDFQVPVNIAQPPVNTHITSVEFSVKYRRQTTGLSLVGAYGLDGTVNGTIVNGDVIPGDPVFRTTRVRFTANPELNPAAGVLGNLMFHADLPETPVSSEIVFDSLGVAFNDFKTVSQTLPNVVRPLLAPFGTVGPAGQATISGRCRQVILTPGSASFALEQSIPNPASSEAQITYSLDRTGPMSLVLYNAVGTPLRTLVEGPGKPGIYRVSLDVSDLRTGVYYYRLECYGAVQSRAMNIMR